MLYFDGALQSGGRSKANDWAKSIKRVASFDSVEDFWVRARIFFLCVCMSLFVLSFDVSHLCAEPETEQMTGLRSRKGLLFLKAKRDSGGVYGPAVFLVSDEFDASSRQENFVLPEPGLKSNNESAGLHFF